MFALVIRGIFQFVRNTTAANWNKYSRQSSPGSRVELLAGLDVAAELEEKMNKPTTPGKKGMILHFPVIPRDSVEEVRRARRSLEARNPHTPSHTRLDRKMQKDKTPR